MLDRVLAILSLAVLIAFVGVVALFVGISELIVVSAIVLAMVVYDFWPAIGPRKKD